MIRKLAVIPIGILAGIMLASATGCGTIVLGPDLGIPPIPDSPCRPTSRNGKRMRHGTTSVMTARRFLGPIQAGAPVVALDTPSDDEVMRALEKARPVQGGFPIQHEVQRNRVRIIVEPIADYIDPPRVYPLVGPAQLHHAQYKCIGLLLGDREDRLADPVHDHDRGLPGSRLHRPRPLAHGRQRRSGPGNRLPGSSAALGVDPKTVLNARIRRPWEAAISVQR